jgi:hypothetical protein
MRQNEAEKLWREFIHEPTGLCGLCGNSGWVDTRGPLASAANPNVGCGVRQPCICPNGRSVKEQGAVTARFVSIR